MRRVKFTLYSNGRPDHFHEKETSRVFLPRLECCKKRNITAICKESFLEVIRADSPRLRDGFDTFINKRQAVIPTYIEATQAAHLK